jgi:hypothetical protein
MSAIITVTCTGCGTANDVPATAMLASVEGHDLDCRLAGSICWICCGCLDVVTEPVAWRPFLSLLTAGVPLLLDDTGDDDEAAVSGSVAGADPAAATPAPSPHPEHPDAGPPAFTADDELDLHELLSTDSWFPRLVVACGGASNGADDGVGWL